MKVLEPGAAETTSKILVALHSWKFRPAFRGNEPVEVNAILGVWDRYAIASFDERSRSREFATRSLRFCNTNYWHAKLDRPIQYPFLLSTTASSGSPFR